MKTSSLYRESGDAMMTMKRCAFVIVALLLAAGGPAAQDLERLFKAAVERC